MKLVCMVCGKKFRPGNNPITGVPNGIGMVLPNTGTLFNVCSFCLSYRNAKVLQIGQELDQKGEQYDT